MTKGPERWFVVAALLGSLSVGLRMPQTVPKLTNPVNMSLHEGRLFVSDSRVGIHVYDVTNPKRPVPDMVIPLPGNRGTALKDDILYANDYGSLLAIRLGKNSYEVVKEIHADTEHPGDWVFVENGTGGFGCSCTRNEDVVMAPQSGSRGSSFATFAVTGDYLYYLDYGMLVTMDISVADDPKELSRTPVGGDAETLYPTVDHLFVGGTRGMAVFDRRDPATPERVAYLQHFRACDPVVVSGTVAYVTLRGGNRCGENRDVLLCVSVEDPATPKVIAEKSLQTPYGLAVDSSLLYVSNGHTGFQLLDVTAPAAPEVVNGWPDRATKDFIWADGVLYTLGFDRIIIFDVTDPHAPVILSEVVASVSG